MDKSVHEKSPKSVHEKLPFDNVHEKLPISKKSVHEMSPSHPNFVSFLSSTTELSGLLYPAKSRVEINHHQIE